MIFFGYFFVSRQKSNNPKEKLNVPNSPDRNGILAQRDIVDGGKISVASHRTCAPKIKYNIRGWLTHINNIDSLQIGTDPRDLFAFKINYNDSIQNDNSGKIKKLYNGNIAETNWRSNTDDVMRRYGYEYDKLNRMVNAIYQKPENTVPVTNMYDETLSYDKNGNIQTLLRNGDFDSNIYSAIQIDNLTYTYDSDNKNQLVKVYDATNSPKGFKDIGPGYDDYTYDDFGNMTKDENKGIDSISYNHLNLPVKIYFATGNRIEYLYDATGKKLRKKVFLGNEVAPTDYLDGFQYIDGKLNFFPHDEGYVNATFCYSCDPQVNLFNYVYQYKDHLGNNRMSYGWDDVEDELKILEESHYYPFGLKHLHYNANEAKYEPVDDTPTTTIKDLVDGEQLVNKYKYNGKEWQDELGLAMYDYGARNYDPAIGRWMNYDPKAEEMRRWSPYNYCFDDPMRFVDPDGMGPLSRLWREISSDVSSDVKGIVENLKKVVKAVEKTLVGDGGYMITNGKGGNSGDKKMIRQVKRGAKPDKLDIVDGSGLTQAQKMFKPLPFENGTLIATGIAESMTTKAGRAAEKLAENTEAFITGAETQEAIMEKTQNLDEKLNVKKSDSIVTTTYYDKEGQQSSQETVIYQRK